jgi:hypothetical protein
MIDHLPMCRIILAFAFVLVITPAFAASDTPRFSALPVPSDPKSVWLLDTFTGALSRCESSDLQTIPACSPWAAAPGEQATYRYDPQTQKLVPMNEAARRRGGAE